MQTGELKAGKGLRVPLNQSVLDFIAEKSEELKALWDGVENEVEFWEGLELLGYTLFRDEKYGDRKYIGVGASGEEFRFTITRNKQGILGLDVRLWWG
jgi:hypothetical protein